MSMCDLIILNANLCYLADILIGVQCSCVPDGEGALVLRVGQAHTRVCADQYVARRKHLPFAIMI